MKTMLVLHLAKRGRDHPSAERGINLSQFATLTMQSGEAGVGYLKSKWTEADVLALPEGQEHDYLERKSGQLIATKHDFRTTLSKAISAFANSGGGHIILGQQDDGTIDGLPQNEGRTSIREWLEQVIPNLVQHPLESFRVHRVERDPLSSQIPPDRELIIVDIGDSRLAPHQAALPADDRRYYYREGGRSVPAPHHYLEALRNRLTATVLDVTLDDVNIRKAHRHGDLHAVLELELSFCVSNNSMVACYKWCIDFSVDGPGDCIVMRQELPALGGRDNITLDETILPTRSRRQPGFFGVRIELSRPLEQQLAIIVPAIELRFRSISENHVGQERVSILGALVDLAEFTEKSKDSLKSAGIDFSWGGAD